MRIFLHLDKTLTKEQVHERIKLGILNALATQRDSPRRGSKFRSLTIDPIFSTITFTALAKEAVEQALVSGTLGSVLKPMLMDSLKRGESLLIIRTLIVGLARHYQNQQKHQINRGSSKTDASRQHHHHRLWLHLEKLSERDLICSLVECLDNDAVSEDDARSSKAKLGTLLTRNNIPLPLAYNTPVPTSKFAF